MYFQLLTNVTKHEVSDNKYTMTSQLPLFDDDSGDDDSGQQEDDANNYGYLENITDTYTNKII